VHACNVASAPNADKRRTAYLVRVSNVNEPERGTWATLLREARKAKELTQEELAIDAGLDRSTIYRQEKGLVLPDRDSLRRIAALLDIPLRDAEAVVRGDPDAEPLPPPLPRELARLVDAYSDMGDDDREWLMENVALVADLAEARLARRRASRPEPRRPRRRAG
jgi:transcriptional regulator with XRE-family HTH domain